MKDITSKQLKDITGMSNVQILNALAILSVYREEEYKSRDMDRIAKNENDTFHKYFDFLEDLGYYDN